MRSSTELREPFLDHRLFELALRQPADRKIGNGTGKRLLREMVSRMLPDGVVTAPKRALQTPQREWLRGPLRGWMGERVASAVAGHDSWFDARAVSRAVDEYVAHGDESSFHLWQWISLGMMRVACAIDH
jgi:asparagine synthase (glutamine-hydrolysing)